MTSDQPLSDPPKTLSDRIDIDFALQAARLGAWEVDQATNQVIWDDRCRELFGLNKENRLPYDQAIQYIHPDDKERVDQAVQLAINPQSSGIYDESYRTIGADDGVLRWVRFTGKAQFTPAGQVRRFAGVAQDITEQMQDRQQLVESEARFRQLSERLDEEVQHRAQAIEAVNEALAATNEELLAASEEQLLIRQQLESSEERFRTMVRQAPIAMLILRGEHLILEVANAAMLALAGWDASVIGQPILSIMPELETEPVWSVVNRVYQTGEPFFAEEMPVQFIKNGQPILGYYTFSYTPINENGRTTGILEAAIDVTTQVLARQQVNDVATALQSAIELAELGTFSVDLTTGQLICSPRVADWFGFDSLTADTEAFVNGVGESERDYVRNSLNDALLPGSASGYDVVHSVINAKTGQRRILHALGRVYVDTAGNPLKIEGTAQDITTQRELQLILEQQIQQRTEELEVSNEELMATNEELLATNEEFMVNNHALETANTDLTRSNQNLEQFAYIASHDLQEPLRKIQQFSDLLKSRYSPSDGEELLYLDRMQTAARRMSLLIKDLLAFSRISTSQVELQPVPLTQLISQVLETLSVAIEESNARIEVSALPTVQGDAVQLNQLFQNLLSNALKFRRTGAAGEAIPPHISIRARLLSRPELPSYLQPTRYTELYHQIEVTDNGIGFDEKYVDRIFQVFQRLHGRNEFAGTGVGLAIVQKVVTNHGGAITAFSQPEQGATFTIYLPAD